MELEQVKEYFGGFPEAPYSDTFKWVDADGYEHMMTIRGWEGGAMLKAVEKAKEVINLQGGRPAGKFSQAPALQTPASQPPAPQPQDAPPPPPAVAKTNINTMLISKMTVEPQADGKIKIGLFEDGHKWADLHMSMGLDATLKMLAPVGDWTAEHLSKTTEYKVEFCAEWKNSEKLNSNGKPYKNVVALQPIPF